MDYDSRIVWTKKVVYFFVKRIIDVLLASTATSILLPLMLLVALVIKWDSPGPVFYRGERAAKDGDTFYIYKFRTMVEDAEQKGGYSTAIDDSRFTDVGRFLRRYKLDELPQFFNVILGSMSLVGPRPQVTYYTDQYVGENRLILSVKPGITDLASIYFVDMDQTLGSVDVDNKYKNEVEPMKNRLRVKYVREKSLFLDFRIMIETFFGLFGIHNASGLRINLE